MAKYCPICFGEFIDTVKICPNDAQGLVSDKPKEVSKLSDVYIAASEIEAERIVAFLQSDDIAAKYYQRGISQFPVIGENVHVVVVAKEHADKAKDIISKSISDEVISDDGSFL